MAQANWAEHYRAISIHDYASVPDNDDEEDVWHVMMAPDEVKVISLDRLDDLYRLSLVDDSTLLWQPGMAAWQSLAAVAGLDAQPKPAPLPVRPIAPAPRPVQPLGSFGVVSAPQPLPQRPAPISAPPSAPATLRPVAISDAPLRPAPATSGFGGFVLVLAVVVGLGVALYRNDVLHQAARNVGQESAFLRLEGALGGPGFGTPRAVEAFTGGVAAAALSTAAVAALPSAPAAPVAAPKAAAAAAAPAAAPAAKPAPADLAEAVAVSIDSLPTESKAASKSAVPAQQRASSKVLPSARAVAPAPAKKSRRDRRSDYDPLNGKL